MAGKTKITYIITHLELGGAQKQLLSLLEGIDLLKYTPYLISGSAGYLKTRFLKLRHVKFEIIPELRREVSPISDMIAFFKIRSFIRNNRMDIVHTHSPKASILGRWAAYFAGIENIIYTVHGWPFHEYMNKIYYYLCLCLERITARITKKIIVVSNADLEKGIISRVAKRDKFSLIHYGIDTKRFNAVFERRKQMPAQDKDTVVTISALKRQKNVFWFLKLARDMVDNGIAKRFMIIGDGPLRERVEKRIEDLELEGHVKLKGWVDDISDDLAKASIFVLTSLWEGLPQAAIEAVMCGIQVVVTDTGGIRDIVSPGMHGAIVSAANYNILYNMCANILRDYNEWDKITAKHRKEIDIFYWSKNRMLKEYEYIYDNLNRVVAA